jgi:hypothetical protein
MRDPSGPGPYLLPRGLFLIVCSGAQRCCTEGAAGLQKMCPQSFGEVPRRRARGASVKCFGEGPVGLRRSASERGPRSFGEVLRRRARGASEECFGEAPAVLRRSASEKGPRGFAGGGRRTAERGSAGVASEVRPCLCRCPPDLSWLLRP